jgi:hypothetical protein
VAPRASHPLALAFEWVSKITTVALEMVLPGILGQWLDQRWGTQFLGFAGFALGMTVGMWHLLRMVSRTPVRRPPGDDRHDTSGKPT